MPCQELNFSNHLSFVLGTLKTYDTQKIVQIKRVVIIPTGACIYPCISACLRHRSLFASHFNGGF